MSCDACRSFAFPVMLKETLDKTLLSAERQKNKDFFLQIACLQVAPLEMLFVFFDVRFHFFLTNVRSGLPLEDVGFRNIWRCDSALAWIACYLIDVRQLQWLTYFACMILEMSELNDIIIWHWIAWFCFAWFGFAWVACFWPHIFWIAWLTCFWHLRWIAWVAYLACMSLHEMLEVICCDCMNFDWMTCI